MRRRSHTPFRTRPQFLRYLVGILTLTGIGYVTGVQFTGFAHGLDALAGLGGVGIAMLTSMVVAGPR